MSRITIVITCFLVAGSAAALPGCEKEPVPPPAKPADSAARTSKPSAPAPPRSPTTPSGVPGNQPTVSAPEGAGATIEGSSLKLTGVSLTLPKGWESEAVNPGPMAPVAVLRIPKMTPDGEDGTVRITYFPNMKGMDDSNIERWVGQVTKPDGQPSTRADADIQVTVLSNVRLTTVSLTGTVKLAMRDMPRPSTRMIAAIVDHPKGPHFVVAAGEVKSMESWTDQIMEFLKSAKAE